MEIKKENMKIRNKCNGLWMWGRLLIMYCMQILEGYMYIGYQLL